MKNYFAEIINAFTIVIAFLQTNEVFQIIELSLSILTSCVLICYRVWKWYKAAKADGKITRDEIGEGVQIIVEGKDEIADKINGRKNAHVDEEPQEGEEKNHG